MTAPLLVTPYRAPEALFGLEPVEADGDTARSTMRTAPWMTDTDGLPAAGMLGVLLDDVVGQPTLTARPDGHWPVTTKLSIDVVAVPPADGTILTASSALLSAGARNGIARGEVRDPNGAVVATATIAVHYVPTVPDLGTATLPTPAEPPSGRDILEVLGGTLDGRPGPDARLTMRPGPAIGNVSGHGHGGVLTTLVDVVAAAAVADHTRPVRTSSLRVAFLRPAALDGPLQLDARVVHRGRTTALTRVDVTGGDGKLCTAATVGSTAL